jgi:uncharacterized lipoprotein YddW (UPF0748 family)
MTLNQLLLLFITALFVVLGHSSADGQEPAPAASAGIRGVWVYPATFGSERSTAVPKIQSTLDQYVKAAINTVMIMVKSTSGYVYFGSDVGVREPSYNWDFFAVFLDEATKRKISVHPWFCVFTEGAIQGRVREHPEWLVRSRKSELVPVLNPAHPEARQYVVSLMKEFVSRYPVEWLHLDYIRWPCEPTEDYFSFDTQTRKLFKEYSGEDIATVRAMDSGNPLWNEWIDWNGQQVTIFLRELRQNLTQTGRNVKISAAVFPDAHNAQVLVGQDWEGWVREGLVEMVCPMLYMNHRVFFEKYVRRAVAITQGRCLLSIGVGIGTAHNQNTPESVVWQMRTSRELGADGTVLFSSGSLREEFLKALSN